MKLKVMRREFTGISTIGEMLIDGEYFCHTLEDVVREIKIPYETAIPYGSYGVIIDWSGRFQKLMPLVLNVPGFSGIRIHCGNTDKDTDGCILLGYTKAKDFVGESRKAFDDFFPRLEEGLKVGKVLLTISNGA